MRIGASFNLHRCYATHPELPLRGQEALQAYLTRVRSPFGSAQPKWVGVDLYA